MQFLIALGQNGPWAAGFAFMLWQVLKAWSEDRKSKDDVFLRLIPLMERVVAVLEKIEHREK